MHRDKGIVLGEDQYTNRFDHAPRNFFYWVAPQRTELKRINTSPTKSIEVVQDNRNKAIHILANEKIEFL